MSSKYRTNAFFNGVSSFKTAFPDLSDALVEWKEHRDPEDSKGLEVRKTGYRRGNFTNGLLACSNPACHEGGYQVDRLIAEMLREGETERSGVMLCTGREVSEEARRGPTRCTYRIEYTVALTPREEEKPVTPARKPPHRRGRHRPPRRPSAA